MEAIQLHDKYSEEIIGTVILKEGGTFDKVCSAWDEYLEKIDKDSEAEPDIYDFVSDGNWDLCEVLEIDFYQPS